MTGPLRATRPAMPFRPPRVVAITMVRDEMDILPWTLRYLASQVDEILVLDHGSVDGTREYLGITPSLCDTPIHTFDNPEPGYYQSRFMTELAGRAARDHGAEWIVPFDADEAWTLPDRLDLDGLPAVFLRSWWHVPKADDDGDEPNPLRRILARLPEVQPQPKVMYRYRPDAVIAAGNHTISLPTAPDNAALSRNAAWAHRLPNSYEPLSTGEIRHYPFRSLDHIRRKIRNGMSALDAAPDLPRGFCHLWRELDAFDKAGALPAWWSEFTSLATDETDPLLSWDH